MTQERICPYCLNSTAKIHAVFNGKQRDGAMWGGYLCTACDGQWDEYAHKDGRRLLKLRNGRMVNHDELRGEA